MLGQGGHQLGEGRIGGSTLERFAGHQAAFRQLSLWNVRIDGQVRSHVGHPMRLELARGAVFKGQVEALVLEQPLDVGVAEVGDEVGVDQHVDIAVLHHYAGGGNLPTELGVNPAQDAGEEGLVEHHAQHVRAEVPLVLDPSDDCFCHGSLLSSLRLYYTTKGKSLHENIVFYRFFLRSLRMRASNNFLETTDSLRPMAPSRIVLANSTLVKFAPVKFASPR